MDGFEWYPVLNGGIHIGHGEPGSYELSFPDDSYIGMFYPNDGYYINHMIYIYICMNVMYVM